MTAVDWVDRAAKEYRAGRPLLLLFDFDGTLAPIVAHPILAVLPSTTRDLLAGLAALPHVAIGIISGRELGQLKERIGLSGLAYAGSGGMQIELGGEHLVDEALAEFDKDSSTIVATLTAAVSKYPGAWIEKKPGCLAIHHRSLQPLLSVCLQQEVRESLVCFLEEPPVIRLRDVCRALEIALSDAWTKADAIDRILAARESDAYVVFAGDGANDEEAVARVNALGGLTIGIGPDSPPGTTLRRANPEVLAADLARLQKEIAPAPSPALAKCARDAHCPVLT